MIYWLTSEAFRSKKPAAILISALFLAFIIVLIYFPVLNNGFVAWDDDLYVYENNNIRTIDVNFIKSLLTDEFNLWHPLTIISHAIDYAIWGLNPWGHHLTSLILHALNTALFFIVIIKLIEYGRSANDAKYLKTSPNVLLPSIITSLIFGIHPIHVESVAWISDRKDLLCTFFFLLSIISFLKYAISANSKRSIFYILSLFFFLLALISKPMAVSLPLVLLILDFYPLKRLSTKTGLKNIRLVLVEKIPFLFLTIISSLITIYAYHSTGSAHTIETVPLITRTLLVVKAYIFYLVKMILPFNMAPLYPKSLTFEFLGLTYTEALILFTTITLFCIMSLKKTRLLISVWLFYIITLLPVIGIVQSGIPSLADRYIYLPSLGPFLLAGSGLAFIFERYQGKRYRIVIFGILLLSFGLLAKTATNQIAVWHDSLTLWSHQIETYPNSGYKAYDNRGIAYGSLGNYHQAIKDFDRAIELNPNNAVAYSNRGNAYNSLGKRQQALEDLNKAIKLDPQYFKAYNNRGNAYFGLKDYNMAIEDYKQTIKLDSQFAPAYYNVGRVYLHLGENKESRTNFNKAALLGSKEAQAYLLKNNAFKE